MRGFITDNNNDLTLDSLGNIQMLEGIEAYRQHIVNVLRLQQYEYPYDPGTGINWLGYVLGKGANIQAWEAQVLQTINAMPFVEKIVDWSYNIEKRNFLFSLTVKTDLGIVEIKG